MPATGARSGTPALSSDMVDAHTEPIDVEPFEPSASDTCRIAYGNSSRVGSTGTERPLGESAVADLTSLRGADPAGLTRGIRRKVVVVHVALGLFRCQGVELLLHAEHVQGAHADDLGLSALEQRRAVGPGNRADLRGQRANLGQPAPVDAHLVPQDTLAHHCFGEGAVRGADLLLAPLEFLGEGLTNLVAELVDSQLPLGLARDGQGLREIGSDLVLDRGVDVVGVVEEQRELANGLGRVGCETLLRLAQAGDERLCRFETLGDNLLGGGGPAAADQVPGARGGLSLDHHDRNVAVGQDPTGHDHVEHGVLELRVQGERHPLVLDQREPHGADGPAERQARDLGGRRRGVDGDHVVQMIRMQRHHRDDDLDLVAQALRERRAQRPVGEAAGKDGLLAGPALAAEERAGDSPGGVHPLLDVDGQREEVKVLLGLLGRGGRRQDHGLLVEVDDGGAGGLSGQLPGLEADSSGAEAAVVEYGLGGVDLRTRHGSPSLRFRRWGRSDVEVGHAVGVGLRWKRPGWPCSARIPGATTEDRSRTPTEPRATCGWDGCLVCVQLWVGRRIPNERPPS